QLIFEFVPAAAAACVGEIGVREFLLRILIEVLHVRMGGGVVEVEVILLNVLAVIAFAIGQAEQALLEDRILAVPQGKGKAKSLLIIRNACQAVLGPAIGTGAGLIM